MFHQLTHFVRHLFSISSRWLIIVGLLLIFSCALVSWRVATTPHALPTRTPVYLPTSQTSQKDTQALNLFVTENAAYEVASGDLQAAGFTAEPEQIAITWRGQPVPFEIVKDAGGFRLRFYGQASDSRYTTTNVYQLRVGKGLMMTQVAPPAPTASASSIYTATIHREENLLYAPQATGIEGWFGKMIPAASTDSFEIEIANLAEGEARLRLVVWSDTLADISPDHHLQASINGQRVLDMTWDGIGVQVLQAEIPAGVLKAGVNQVEISVPGDTGVNAERSYLDWLEIEYPHPATVEDDFVILEGAGNPVQFSGFSESAISIWQVNSITQTQRIAAESALAPGELGQHYLLVGPQGFHTPRLQAVAALPDLRQLPAASYLAFGPDDLLAAIQPLLDYHTQNGLTTAAIPLQAIYDQFGDGFAEPQALQRFLAYVSAHWPEPPQYALLLGDFTYDPRGYIVTPDANRMPSYFVHTHFGGETASDVPFADMDGDGLPDLAVGRLPARTADEIRAYASKAIAYAQQSDTDWRVRLLAVADGQEVGFSIDAQTFLDQFTDSSFEETLFAPPAGVKDANAQINASFSEGYGLVSYFGHGSIAMWGKDRLFTTDDVADLKNANHLPVVVNMNCLTGLFTHPKAVSLTETFLWQENAGAVAVLAPTSLTLPSDQAMLSGALAREFSNNPQQSLGESFLAAQRQMPVTASGANEVLLTFLFFGDPALQPWAK